MKAISIRQPWATWIAEGKKTIETRPWKTEYRGDLLIVSSKTPSTGGLPLGQALCVVRLADCRPLTKDDENATRSKFLTGLYAWVLKDVRKLKPFPVRGHQGLYEVDF